MSPRALLVGLIVLATVGFVVGTTIERNSGERRHESAATSKAKSESVETHGEGRREGEAAHGAEGASSESTAAERHPELKPLGIDIEAVPFVALAAMASLGLALAAWRRPQFVLLLLAVGAAMLVFALLDVREVFHQSDENRTGLTVLAAAIAAMHAGAGVVAGLMARRAARSTPGPSAPAATIPA